jgi:glycosyltransferase involved in cell wall biosynthesis
VSGRDRLDLLRTARLFVAPSHQENFGLALLEALASGTPVVVSPGVNLARDIVAAGAGWVCDEPRVSLTHVLRTALANDEILRTKGGRARRYAERFRWPAIATALTKVYDEVLSESRRPITRLNTARSEAH